MNDRDGETGAEAIEELKAQVHELQQKRNIAEVVIDDKDGELSAALDEVSRVKEVAKIDLREAEREKRECLLEHEELSHSQARGSRE